ncbi:MAG: trigger factor [Thainema sp.]
MKVTQERLPESRVGLEIEIPSEMSQKTYDKVLGQLMRSANIPGFRRGKVPRHILIQRFGSTRISASVIEELIQNGIEQAIKQEDVDAIGNYQLRSSFEELMEQFKPGQPLTFSASVDVPPEVTLKDYEGLSVQAEEVQYDASRVDEVLSEYQNRFATLVPVEDRAAQKGDSAVVDFVGKIVPENADAEPEEFPGGSAEDFQLELEEGRFIEGFIGGIIGMKPGETKDVNVTFPEQYAQEDLAGKPVVFTIMLKELKEKELPELDDDFAQEVSEFETMQELRESLEKQYKEEAESKTASNKEKAVLDELVKHIEVDLPKTLIDREVNYMLSQTAVRLSQQGIDVKQLFNDEMLPRLREQSRPEAINRLQRTLALGEVAKQQDIKVEEDEIKTKAEEMLQEVPAGQRKDIDLDRLNEVVQEDLLKEKILAWLEESWTVELVPEGTLSAEEETDEAESADASNEVVEAEAEVVAEEE